MNLIAKGVSYLFHPLFIVAMMFGLLIIINPYLFVVSDPKAHGLIAISVITMSIMFPLLSIFLMKMLGLISSLEMKKDKERVGPLIATGIFYLWLYINIKSNNLVPQAFSFFVLGSTIALFMAFFISNFSRISLHAIGVGGLLMGLLFIRYNFSYETFFVNLGLIGKYQIHVDLLIILVILIAGLVGTSRLYLKAHTKDEIYMGYLVGCFSQIIAYKVFF